MMENKIPLQDMHEYVQFALVDRCMQLEQRVDELEELLTNSKRYNEYLKKENDLAREVQRKNTEELSYLDVDKKIYKMKKKNQGASSKS